MNSQHLLYRKIGYFCAIALLLIPLALLSQPESTSSPGGKLAKLRKEYHLSQAQIGDIDPTSETIKLATFGLRGVAAMVLWSKANEYKIVKDWTRFDATLQQITKVMPNSIGVWRFQAWNVSYNISSEFDDFRQRYIWILKGIDFLKEGVKHNAHEPRLLYDLGWFYNHKIGEADSRKEYRRMFLEETKRDNWLVGKDYYLQAQQLADREKIRVKGITPVIFHSRAAVAQRQYAEAIQEDGIPQRYLESRSPTFLENAKLSLLMGWKKAWVDAYAIWDGTGNSLGNRDMFAQEGVYIRLRELDLRIKEVEDLLAQLETLQPGLTERILNQPQHDWSPAGKTALKVKPEKRTEQQKKLTHAMILELVYRYENPYKNDFMKMIDEKNKPQARKIRTQLRIARYRWWQTQGIQDVVNYRFWKIQTKSQADRTALAMHYWVEKARAADQHGRFILAKEYYEKAFVQQYLLFLRFPEILEDPKSRGIAADDTLEIVQEYKKLLVLHLDMSFPKEFIFSNFIHKYDPENEYKLNLSTADKSSPAKAKENSSTEKKDNAKQKLPDKKNPAKNNKTAP